MTPDEENALAELRGLPMEDAIKNIARSMQSSGCAAMAAGENPRVAIYVAALASMRMLDAMDGRK